MNTAKGEGAPATESAPFAVRAGRETGQSSGISPAILAGFAILGKNAFVVSEELQFLCPPLEPAGPGRARAYSDLLRNWSSLEMAIDGILAGDVHYPHAFGEADGGVLTVVPLGPERPDGATTAARRTFLVLHEEPPSGLGAAVRRGGFSLTPVEGVLADHICSGVSVRQAADRMGISYHTARKYLARIFEKTHVRRQTELVSLLLGPRRQTGRPVGGAAAGLPSVPVRARRAAC
jgi:DNA-binding CsgD family transcriptional regulator